MVRALVGDSTITRVDMGVWEKNGSEAQEFNLVNFAEMSRVSRANSLGRSLSWKQF